MTGTKVHSISYKNLHEDQVEKKEAEDEFLLKRKYTTEQWLTIVTLCLGHFAAGACVSLQGPFFPQEAELKGASPTEYGLIYGTYQLSMFICAPMFGKMISYVRPKLLLISGVVTVGISCISFGLLDFVEGHLPFVALAFIIRILEGIGGASFRTSSHAIAAVEFPDSVSTTYAWLRTSTGVGLITGPTLGGVLYDISGYQLPFYVVGAILILDALVVYYVLPVSNCKEHVKSSSAKEFWLDPGVIMYFLVTFTCHNYIGYNAATLEPHLREFHLSGIHLGLLFALYATIFAIGSPFWGWLCDEKKISKVLVLSGCISMILSLLLIGPIPVLHIERRLEAITVSLVLLGLGTGLKLVSAFSGCVEHTLALGYPKNIATYGLIASMGASAQSLGAFVGPSVGGFLMENLGYDYSTLVVLSFEIMLLLMILIHTPAGTKT